MTDLTIQSKNRNSRHQASVGFYHAKFYSNQRIVPTLGRYHIQDGKPPQNLKGQLLLHRRNNTPLLGDAVVNGQSLTGAWKGKVFSKRNIERGSFT